MSPGSKRLLGIGLGLALAAAVVGFAVFRGFGSPDIPSGAVALVEDAPNPTITVEEVATTAISNARIESVGALPAIDSPEFERLQDDAVNELILSRWVAGEAEELGIAVTDAEIDEGVQRFVEENFNEPAQFERFKQQSQLSDEEIADFMRVLLISRGVNRTFAPGIPNTPEGYQVSDSLIEAFYEQNKFNYEIALGDPTEEREFATVDQVRELILTALRPGLTRSFVNAARTDFNDKWRARTICAPGFEVERCRNGSADVPEGAPPVLSTSPIPPGLAGLVSNEPQGVPQSPYPQPFVEGDEVPGARDSDGPDTTPEILPAPAPAS